MKNGFILLILLLWGGQKLYALDPYGFETFSHVGHVFSRSEIRTDIGGPMWAEYRGYDPELSDQPGGGFTHLPSLDNIEGSVYPKSLVLDYQAIYNGLMSRTDGDVEKITATQFNSAGFQLFTADGRVIRNLPKISYDSNIVMLPGKNKRLSDSGESLEIYAFPFDITLISLDYTDNEGSVFVSNDNSRVVKSRHRIGPLTGYYKKGNDYVKKSEEYSDDKLSTVQSIYKDGPDVKLLNPIYQAELSADTGYSESLTYTEKDGGYVLRGRLAPCPGFSYSTGIDGWLRLNYGSFSPRGVPGRSYYIRKTGYHLCFGEAAFPPDNTLIGQMVHQNAIVTVSSAGSNVAILNYDVGVSIFSGQALFWGVNVGEETIYEADSSAAAQVMIKADYDGDGQQDDVVRGVVDDSGQFSADPLGSSYGVFYSTLGNSDDRQPDFTKLIDSLPNETSEGLLSQISYDDLGETDIYIFRESTGQLITEINGVEDYSSRDVRNSEVGSSYTFSVAARGPEDMQSFARTTDFLSWQAANKMSPELQAHEADHLRPGEPLRVVAINRPTGYIGSVRTKMSHAQWTGNIGSSIPPIFLQPPNLKVWATRRYQREGLYENSDTVRKTISNSGAASTDDYVIEVHTEWVDSLGQPLPAGLVGKGYTGRLTKQISDSSFDSTVTEFDISPGRHMQLLRFSGDEPSHYYFQVNGYPSGEQNDFSTSLQVDPDLIHRPNYYVPVRVPLYAEQDTLDDQLAIRNSDLELVDEYDVEPLFNWVYRPELSFSTVDIIISEIYDDLIDEVQDRINLLDSDIPTVDVSSDFVSVVFELLGSEFDRITSFDGEQEFIFAIGAQEIKVNIDKGEGEEQQISFSNLEHLSSLEVEDFLTMSLYLNHDSQNTLWEWGFENLIVTSRDADNDLETDDTYYVSADDPIVPMIAILSGYSDREPELKKPMTLRWESDNGDLSVQQEVNDTTGIFKTELTMPVQAGSRATLTAELAGSDNPIEFKTIEVVPGAPANIVVNQSSGASSLGVLGTASQQYEITITDAHGNIVQDGTSVTYSLEGYAEVTAEDTGTTSGKAYVTVTGTERFDDAIKLNITSGNANRTIDLSSAELAVSLNIPTQMQIGLTQEATVTVTNPVGPTDGMEVAISAPALGIEDQNIVLDENGQATFTLIAPPVPAETYIHARVGYAGAVREAISVVAPDANIHTDNYRPLMGESTQAGSYAYTRFDDAQIDLGYEVEKSLTLKGVAGDTLTAQLGDAYYPNAMPELALAMDASMIQSLSADAPKDDTGTYSIDASGVTLDGSSLYGAGSSTRFDGTATITATASSLGSQQRPNWAIDIKPEQAGTILNLGGGQSLSIGGNELVYRVTTTDGIFQARAPVQLDKWQRVAARVTDTQLELYVDDLNTPYTTAYSGSIQSGSGDLTIGAGYTGLMQGLRFYDGQSQPLLAINNGGSSADIQADASGNVSLSVNSLGNLNANGEALGLTYVHLVHNGERVHIPVISEDAFKQVAGAAANIGLAGPPLVFNSNPDYNITDPWAPRNLPFSSVMPQAQAFGWLDALDFIIPVSSIITITEQIGRIGTEEFDPVALIIAGLDVALVFSGPLRGPLKLAFDPLAKLISNPATQKLAKILGPFFGNIIEKVAKSRSIDPILNLLPFLMIVGEIAADEEAREAIPIIFDAINSSEDLQVWFDYFNLPDDGWEGDTQPQLDLSLANLDSSALPLGMLIPQAYAAGKPKRVSGATAGKRIKEVMKGFANGDIDAATAARSITTSMKVIIKEGSRNTTIRQALTDPKTLKAGMTLVLHGGIRHFKNLLSGKDEKGRKVTARTPVFLQLAAIAYLESNINCEEAGCWTTEQNEKLIDEIRVLYGKALGSPLLLGYDNARVAGYQFQLTMAALLHAMDQVGLDTYGKIVAIEDTQRVFLQQYQTDDTVIERDPRDRNLKGDFNRKIDFVMDNGGDKPLFLEVKSYKGRQGSSRSSLTKIDQSTLKSRFDLWNMKSNKSGDASNHKQYTADRILVTDNARITNPDIRDATKAAGEIKWLFQNYSQETVGGLDGDQIKLIRKWLSREPGGDKGGINASLGLKQTQSYTTLKSEDKAKGIVDLFNMKTLFQDSGSALVERLFDMGSYTPEEKAKMQDKIKELVEELLPADITVD